MKLQTAVSRVYASTKRTGNYVIDGSELRSCVKVEVAPVRNKPYGFCGRKATLQPTNVEARVGHVRVRWIMN